MSRKKEEECWEAAYYIGATALGVAIETTGSGSLFNKVFTFKLVKTTLNMSAMGINKES